MTESHHSHDPDLIWHYTNGAGLLGILNEVQPHIFATDALYLNDTRELLIAVDHQVAQIKRSLPEGDVVAEHSVAHLFKLWLGDALEHVSPPEGVYITSFCKNGDLLSQWRGYGSGIGYALGVSRAELDDARGAGDRLIEVEYGQPDAGFLKHLQPTALQIGEQLRFDSDPAVVAALKDPSFAEEDELRLVARAGARKVHFRSGPRGLIPFLKIDLPLECIKAVCLGPGLSDEPAVRAVKRLGVERGLPNLVVRTSSVPYRG